MELVLRVQLTHCMYSCWLYITGRSALVKNKHICVTKTKPKGKWSQKSIKTKNIWLGKLNGKNSIKYSWHTLCQRNYTECIMRYVCKNIFIIRTVKSMKTSSSYTTQTSCVQAGINIIKRLINTHRQAQEDPEVLEQAPPLSHGKCWCKRGLSRGLELKQNACVDRM